jgi:hypothetical protein
MGHTHIQFHFEGGDVVMTTKHLFVKGEKMAKLNFTGKETPQELRQALIDCSAVMWDQYSRLVGKDVEMIGRFSFANELFHEILEEMARRDLPGEADLSN